VAKKRKEDKGIHVYFVLNDVRKPYRDEVFSHFLVVYIVYSCAGNTCLSL
jgi:hypothetical protein